jgi:hypothetical protein
MTIVELSVGHSVEEGEGRVSVARDKRMGEVSLSTFFSKKGECPSLVEDGSGFPSVPRLTQ